MDQNNARTLAITALLDEFESRISETVRSTVRSEMELALSKARPPTPPSRDHASDGRKQPGNLVDFQEKEKARAALREPVFLSTAKEGRGLIDAAALARFLDVSERSLRRHAVRGALPEPVTIGRRSKPWPIEEILAWVFHGCAPGHQWQTIRTKAICEYRAAFKERAG